MWNSSNSCVPRPAPYVRRQPGLPVRMKAFCNRQTFCVCNTNTSTVFQFKLANETWSPGAHRVNFKNYVFNCALIFPQFHWWLTFQFHTIDSEAIEATINSNISCQWWSKATNLNLKILYKVSNSFVFSFLFGPGASQLSQSGLFYKYCGNCRRLRHARGQH